METFEVRPIGHVDSPLRDRSAAPKQGSEGGPQAWLEFDSRVAAGLRDLQPGSDVLLLTWLHRSDREVLEVHPRDDPEAPLTGVFSTRSADRPNPVGLHRVHVLAVEGCRILVSDLEAIHGTPVVDVKPVLSDDSDGGIER